MQLVHYQISQRVRRVVPPQDRIPRAHQQDVQHLVIGQQDIRRLFANTIALSDYGVTPVFEPTDRRARVAGFRSNVKACCDPPKFGSRDDFFGQPRRLVRGQRIHWVNQNRLDAAFAGLSHLAAMLQHLIGTHARSVTPLDLDALYRQRLQVEVDLRSIKAVMGMDILSAKSSSMIDKEIAVHLLAYNLVRGLMARAAVGAQVIARALSFKSTLQLLLAFQQHLRWAAGKRTDIMIANLLGAISAMTLPIRPGRIEPRAIKRRSKNHALLTVPRHVARAAIIRARQAYA